MASATLFRQPFMRPCRGSSESVPPAAAPCTRANLDLTIPKRCPGSGSPLRFARSRTSHETPPFLPNSSTARYSTRLNGVSSGARNRRRFCRSESEEKGTAHAKLLADGKRLRKRRGLPSKLPPPPKSWAAEFPAMAVEAGTSATIMNAAFEILNDYWLQNELGDAGAT
jgi:hypothetical protein